MSLAWEQRQFECSLCSFGGEGGERVFEASSAVVKTISEGGIILIARDLTDRARRMAAEKEAVSANVARDKDDEVNRFMRHEVKSCIRLQPRLLMVAALIPWGCSLHPMGLQPSSHRVAASTAYGCR